MKLTTQQELVVAGILILYVAFVPAPTVVKDALRAPLGKVLALAGIVYVWKYLSTVAAILLLVVYARDADVSFAEHLDVAPTQCKCSSPGFSPNETKSACIDKDGKTDKMPGSLLCQCPEGYGWDVVAAECKANQTNQSKPIAPVTIGTPPPPPPAEATMSTTPAPAISTGPVTSPALPMTTGAAAQQMMQSSPPVAPVAGGAQPSATSVSTPAPV